MQIRDAALYSECEKLPRMRTPRPAKDNTQILVLGIHGSIG